MDFQDFLSNNWTIVLVSLQWNTCILFTYYIYIYISVPVKIAITFEFDKQMERKESSETERYGIIMKVEKWEENASIGKTI